MSDCITCGKTFDNERAMKTHVGRVHQDDLKENLIELYIRQNMKSSEIAEKLDLAPSTVGRWITRFGLRGKDPANFHLNPVKGSPYPRWMGTGVSGRGKRVRVHQLLAIAEGADAHKVFSGRWDVDHINGCHLDNRPDNIRLMPKGEHGAKDGQRSSMDHSQKDLLYMMQFAFNAKPFVEALNGD